MSCCDCFENLAPGVCRENITTTVAALEQGFSSLPVDQCCLNVSKTVSTEAYQFDPSGGIYSCGLGDRSEMCFHEIEDLSTTDNFNQPSGPGRYIVRHFRFSQQDCIRSISFQPSQRIASTTNGLEFSIYRKYGNQGGFLSLLYEVVESFAVEIRQDEQSNIASATPLNEACFSVGDTLGFYIPSDSAFSILGRTGDSDAVVYNVTESVIGTACSQLNKFTEALPPLGSFLEEFNPLLSVSFGKEEDCRLILHNTISVSYTACIIL